MFSVNIRAKSSCDILKSVGISRGIGIFFSPVRSEGCTSRSAVQQALIETSKCTKALETQGFSLKGTKIDQWVKAGTG